MTSFGLSEQSKNPDLSIAISLAWLATLPTRDWLHLLRSFRIGDKSALDPIKEHVALISTTYCSTRVNGGDTV
jgi:hypothetical protein